MIVSRFAAMAAVTAAGALHAGANTAVFRPPMGGTVPTAPQKTPSEAERA